MTLTKGTSRIGQQITAVFEELVDEYLRESNEDEAPQDLENAACESQDASENFDSDKERQLINDFLSAPCSCGKLCKERTDFDEIAKSRSEFRSLNRTEKNVFMLSQLTTFMRHSDKSFSARQMKTRVRQKFHYHISIDRPVCKEVFLFYYGETIDRLKRLQKHKLEAVVSTTTHGNVGRMPIHACSKQDKNDIKAFITNYAATHGMPDPGRDLRHGKGRLRILLPSVLNYKSVHRSYELSLHSENKSAVGYRTFLRMWHELCPHIIFSKPKTDLCMTCEDFKKEINQITSDLDEKREIEKTKIYKKAIDHIEYAKKERTYYNACSKLAEENYHKLGLRSVPKKPKKANSRNIMQHYSWDFAQQLHYLLYCIQN